MNDWLFSTWPNICKNEWSEKSPNLRTSERNVRWKLLLNGSNLKGLNRGRRGKTRLERGGGKRRGKIRGGGKMLGFYHSLYFSVCTSELFTNQTPSRPTQMKILQNVREVTEYLNYLFVCFIMPEFCDLEWLYLMCQYCVEMQMSQSCDESTLKVAFSYC